MNLLAIELTAAQCSLALFVEDRLRAERSWPRDNRHHQRVFTAMTELFNQAAISPERIDVFAVGRGPGNYSGMRLGLSIAQSLALPGDQPVYSISSGAALAFEISQTASADPIAVAGNARRGQLWLGLFERTGNGPRLRGDWKLMAPSELDSVFSAGGLGVTADWPAIDPHLNQSRSQWIPESRYPGAAYLGQLALNNLRRGVPSEPLSPLYLHAAV